MSKFDLHYNCSTGNAHNYLQDLRDNWHDLQKKVTPLKQLSTAKDLIKDDALQFILSVATAKSDEPRVRKWVRQHLKKL